MKKYLLLIFLLLSSISFAKWEIERNENNKNIIVTSSINSEPKQSGKIYISKNSLKGSLTYYSMTLLVDKCKPSPIENNQDDSLEKIKVNVKIGYLDEVEYPGLVNKNKPYEIYLIFISNEMELLKGSKTLRINYEGENSTSCWLDFDLSGLDEASKSLKTRLIF
ncbi:hypothetical protein [Fusobacterium sp.]|uniref:hypothetical protein n=1 Tax=Fusobacterium sp. TaxID=68766 RepID=UPI00261CC438|nr:hypothetical protein [Fusobacterium sp.]